MLGSTFSRACTMDRVPHPKSKETERDTSGVCWERDREPSEPLIRCPLCGWPPARKTNGSAPAATSGIRSRPEESLQPVSTSGPKRYAYPVADGRRIRIGTPRCRVRPVQREVASLLAYSPPPDLANSKSTRPRRVEGMPRLQLVRFRHHTDCAPPGVLGL